MVLSAAHGRLLPRLSRAAGAAGGIPARTVAAATFVHPRILRATGALQPSPARMYSSGRATEFLQNHDPDLTESQRTVRDAVGKICRRFDDAYWLEHDTNKTFPLDFYDALARDGWLGICMPEQYGGAGLGIADAATMMQTVSECGGGMAAASSVHMNIFGLQPVVKYGTPAQKKEFLEPLVQGRQRACFAVTEPNTGLDTLRLQSQARRDADGSYLLSGQKVWISTAQHAHKILILVRTTPLEHVTSPARGLSLFYTDLDASVAVSPIEKMGRGAVDSNALMFDGWRVPAAHRIGREGDGFAMILHGMNAERILIAAEALGLGYAAVRRAARYAQERVVFGRPIGANQAIQHGLADCWMRLEAARLVVQQAARLYDGEASVEEGGSNEGSVVERASKEASGGRHGDGEAGKNKETDIRVGEYANAAKYLAAEAAFAACERAVLVHGGMGYAKEYHVERYLREVFIPRIAPVSREMILNYIGQRVLGLPKSY